MHYKSAAYQSAYVVRSFKLEKYDKMMQNMVWIVFQYPHNKYNIWPYLHLCIDYARFQRKHVKYDKYVGKHSLYFIIINFFE